MSADAPNHQPNALKAWMLPVGLWAVGPLVGFLASLVWCFGASANEEFFETCALIAPLFGLALFVELALVLGQLVKDQGPTAANRGLARSVLRANAGLICVSEGLALYAVATGRASTFLVVSVVVPMLIQVQLLVDCGYQRIGIGRIRGG
jgi:hypothetical protein